MEADGEIIACAGIEHCADAVLLRSLAVAPAARGRGHARRLVKALRERARGAGARRLWLLTNTAADWFTAHGWHDSARDSAPAGVRDHAQFRYLCPAGSRVMFHDL